MAIDDGGQVASITYRAALIMSVVGGLVSRDTIPGAGKPEVIAKQSCDIADAVIKRIRETEKTPEQPAVHPPKTDG